MPRSFKSLLLASASLLSFGAASAADLPSTKAPPMVPVIALYSWAGFYGGLNLGGGWVNDDVVGINVGGVFTGNIGNAKGSGVVFGGQLGYNWQSGPWVYGIEADLQWSGINDRFTTLAGAPPLAYPANTRTDIDWFGTARLRLGYSFDRTLLYVTGGLAVVDVNYRITDLAGVVIRDGATGFSWTVGGGVEHAFTNNWSAKLEYLYVDAGKERLATGAFSTQATQGFHLGRVGINYRW